MNRKIKVLSIVSAVLVACGVLFFAPIIPVKAQVAEGYYTRVPAQVEKILQMGNYSLAFELHNFSVSIDNANISAADFTVKANTRTVMNVTTGYLIVDLYNVHVVVNNGAEDGIQPFSLDLGHATLNIDLYMEGG